MKQKSASNNGLYRSACLIAIAAVGVVFIFNCQVVKLKEEKSENGIKIYFDDKDFDANKMVADMWDSKLVPYIQEKAKDFVTVVNEIKNDKENAGKQFSAREKKEGEAWNFIVTGEGTIQELDSTSRAGKLILEIPSLENTEIIIQMGPVIKGTSIRDCLDFVSFDQFTNQIEFASFSNSLNKRVFQDVLKDIRRAENIGKTLKFYGTFTMPDDVSKILITPVIIEVL